VGPAQRELLATAIVSLEQTARGVRGEGGTVPFIDLPLAVAASERGTAADPPVALAGACSPVFLSLDMFDDLADGDRKPHWAGRTAAEIDLAAATLLAAVVPLVLARMDVPPVTRVAMQETLAGGLLRMSAGQQTDLALAGRSEVLPDAVLESVLGKSGEQQATYCAVAAQWAGAAAERVSAYAAFGRCLGAAGQLASDCDELLNDPQMRDLRNGARTLPIALHLHRLDGPGRAAFLDLLDKARSDAAARDDVRTVLKQTGAIRRVLLRSQLYRQQARRLATELCPDASRRAPLERMLAA
jgi:geranylgeranyl pyrophosphate synthase